MSKLTIQVPTWTEKEVEIPDECPQCGAEFWEGGHLKEYDLTDTVQTGNLMQGRGRQVVFETETSEDPAETEYHVVGYQCDVCGWATEGVF